MPESEVVDWTISDDTPPLCLRQIILDSARASLVSRSDEFSALCKAQISHGGASDDSAVVGDSLGPAVPFSRESGAVSIVESVTSQHAIYFLSLDQIGHHLVLETHDGRARVLQSFVKEEETVMLPVCSVRVRIQNTRQITWTS